LVPDLDTDSNTVSSNSDNGDNRDDRDNGDNVDDAQASQDLGMDEAGYNVVLWISAVIALMMSL
jgi:hypothetical protein